MHGILIYLFSYMLYSLGLQIRWQSLITGCALKNLLFPDLIVVVLTVDEQQYDLFGVVCSDSESDKEWELLESYLTQTKFVHSSPQSMARTKQTKQGGHQVDLLEENHWQDSVLHLPNHKVTYWKAILNWKKQRTYIQ